MATVVNRAFGATEKASISSYTDVAANAWYYDDMAKAVQMKTFVGSGDKLNPDNNITREEAFAVLARAFKLSGAATSALDKFSDKALVSSWATDEAAYLIAAGYIAGSNGQLNPKQNITRAEFAQIMDNILKNYIKTAGTYTTDYTGNVMINVPGVTLKDIKITGDLIIGDGVGNGDVTLDGVTVTGRTIIRGGGVNSIKITGNTNLQNIIIARVDGQVRVYAEDGTQIGDVMVDGSDNVTIEGNFGAVTVTAPDITVTATSADIVAVTIYGDRSIIIVDSKSTIDKAVIDGEDAKIITETGSKIENITANGNGTTIRGTGTINTVDANGDNTSVNTPGTSVTTGHDSDGTTVGGKPVDKNKTTVNPGKTSSNNHGHSSGAAAALALSNAKTAAATEIGKVAAAQSAYTTAGGANTVAVYTEVTAAKNAVDAAVTSNVTADILSTTANLTTKLGALTAATEAFFTYTTSAGAVTIIGYTGSGTVITIPSMLGGNPVTIIGYAAFSSKTTLTNVTIPNSVTSIGVNAFLGCTGLTSVTIPSSVTNIGNSAFYNCNSLTSVTIPSSVTSIENYVFYNCNSLTSVTIPSSVTSIGSNAFAYTGLTSINIPSSVTSIGDRAFEGCKGLTSVTMGGVGTVIADHLMGLNYNAFKTAYDKVTTGGAGTYIGTWNGVWTKYKAVTGITGVATTGTVNEALALAGTVAPADATNQTIAWTVKSGTATITGTNLTATAAGAVVVTATITNGLTASTPYTQDFTITVAAAPVSAVGTAAATVGTKTIVYTLTTGTFDETTGIVTANWTIAGANGTSLVSRHISYVG